MTTLKKCNTLVNCLQENSCGSGCDTKCNFNRLDSSPFGINIIPGSGKLAEFPVSCSDECCDGCDAGNLLDSIRDTQSCPRVNYLDTICVSECQEYGALAGFNFINGDLVIASPESDIANNSCILKSLPIGTDLIDIFPNLLGVNGSIYIVGTEYRVITGFEKLRFVTGSIVIVNNIDLEILPIFPNLLNVGGQNQNLPYLPEGSCDSDCDANCGRSSIIIANNASLKKITGFEPLRQVSNGIYIANNNCLTHICAFVHLYRTDRLVISHNPVLIRIVGFCYLDNLPVGLYILSNGNADDIELTINAFSALENVADLVVVGNGNIKSLIFESVIGARNVVIKSNGLVEFASNITTLKSLIIEYNRHLISIRLPRLVSVRNSIRVNHNAALEILDISDSLKKVGHGIMIAQNPKLAELTGFNKVKYIGSSCAQRAGFNPFPPSPFPPPFGSPNSPIIAHLIPNPCSCIPCMSNIEYDWELITVINCVITDAFPPCFYDASECECPYLLPNEFFANLCSTKSGCGPNGRPCGSTCSCSCGEELLNSVNYSIIIFGNNRLKAIGGFCNLRHVNSNIYIISNPILHTINAFGQLAFAVDVWIRNNPSLKFIIGFTNLLSVRDFVLLESGCLIDFCGLKSLEFAQSISSEAKTAKSIKLGSQPIPSILGYTLYYQANKCGSC